MRITLFDSNGRIVGDSSLEGNQLGKLYAADASDVREAVRWAESNADEAVSPGIIRRNGWLFAVLPLDNEASRSGALGALRVGSPLSRLADSMDRLRLAMLAAALLGISLAGVMGGIVSHWGSRTLRQLATNARRVVSGGGRRRISYSSPDELGKIAGSFNQLADDVDMMVAKLALERDRLETILESMSEAVVALDESRQITLANRSALELMGLKAVPHRASLMEVIRIPALSDLLLEEGGDAQTVEFELPGSVVRRVLARHAPFKTTKGSVVVMHDVTETRRLESIRSEFVANVSHELRTPISVIQANVETLLRGGLVEHPQAMTFLDATMCHAERLSRLIADLLDLSRLEAGQYRLHLQRTNLAVAVARAIDVVDPARRSKEIELHVHVGGELAVLADKDAIEQVLINLLDNAVKYSQAKGIIWIEATLMDGRIETVVRDNGPGLASSHLERLFERFYRADAGRSRELGGTGARTVDCEAPCGMHARHRGGSSGDPPWVPLPFYLAGYLGASPEPA